MKKIISVILCVVLLLTAMLAGGASALSRVASVILFHDFDSVSNVDVFHVTPSIDETEKTEGDGSLLLSSSDGMIELHTRDFMAVERDISECRYISFDLYTSDVNMLKNGDKAIELIDSAGRNGGRMGTTEALTELELKEGWNHIVLPIGNYNVSSGFLPTHLTQVNFFATQVDASGIYRIDNLRFTADEVPGAVDILVGNGFEEMDDGYECFLPKELDSLSFTEGNSSLSINTWDFENVSVAIKGPVNISGATYMTFDVYTTDADFYKNASDTAVSFFNDGAFSGRAVFHAALRSIPLVAGRWNHVVVPLSYTELSDSFDASTLSKIEFYCYKQSGFGGGESGINVKYDNIRFCNYEGIAEQNKAYDVKNRISELGEITINKKSDVEAVRNAFENLNDGVKSLVTNISVLASAEKAIADIENDIAAAKAVEAEIAALGEITSLDKKDDVLAAKYAYEQLTEAQKEYVSPEAQEALNGAIEKIKEFENATAYTSGDTNGDGRIGAVDALLALQAAVGKITLSDGAFSAADVNGDNVLDADDALLILQFTVGKITVFPKK